MSYDFVSMFPVGDDNFFLKSKGSGGSDFERVPDPPSQLFHSCNTERKISDDEYRQVIPDLDEYTKVG